MAVSGIVKRAAAIAALMALGACTQPWTCPSDDWRRAGFADGAEGRDRAWFEGYAKTCAKSGATPDRVAWTEGYEAGLTRYCTEANAYRLGFRGHEYFNVRACPQEDQRRLDQAYHHGFVYREMVEDMYERRGRWPFYPVFPYF